MSSLCDHFGFVCSQETFFTQHVDGEFDLYDLRLRYDLIEPAADHKIKVTVRQSDAVLLPRSSLITRDIFSQVTTPQKHVIHSVHAAHSALMHRGMFCARY